jgi:hypothetical protein
MDEMILISKIEESVIMNRNKAWQEAMKEELEVIEKNNT